MIENSTLIKVKNRDNGTVGYTIPDLGNLHRNFAAGETKEISMEELRKLAWIPGGDVIIKDYFIIENEEAVNELLSDVEPEYFYTEDDIKEILTTGTLDQLKDTLDFAPEGVVELVKSLAVELQLNDVAKRDYILEKTGFNVTTAISINKQTAEDENEKVETQRRAQPITATKNNEAGRRTTTPNYKVVSINK
jgi:hypothetical protein